MSGAVSGISISALTVRVLPTHSPNSSSLLPSPAATAVMTIFGNMRSRRGAEVPNAGCALTFAEVATTASGRGSVAMKHGPLLFGPSASRRATASAIDPMSPFDFAHSRSASLGPCGPASFAPASFAGGGVVDEVGVGAGSGPVSLEEDPLSLAEQLLELLQLFNVAPADFGEPPDEAADLQNALARNGASHLRENERSLPSRGLASLPEIVARTLVRADSSRQIAALAPVLVHNAEDIRFGLVERELRDAERLPRLGWVIENTLAALSLELQQTLPHRLKQSYRRAEVLLESQLEALTAGAQARSDARPWDALDKSIRSRRSLEEVSASASPISKKWRVATGIQVEDFARALSASRVD